jgi:hypothetical protein
MITEMDVYRMFLARRENYAVSHIGHRQGRVYDLLMNGKPYKAVVLASSFDFYEKRYHIAMDVPTLVICYEHTTVLPVAVLSLKAGNFAEPYELPESISDVEEQRCSKVGSKVLLGQYICGLTKAQDIVNNHLPPTTRKRYQERAKALMKRKSGKPVGRSTKAV